MAYEPVYGSERQRVSLKMGPDAAFAACVQAMSQVGSVLMKKDEPFRRLVGRIRVKGLTYATVTVVLEADRSGEESSVITVSASAPEGTAGPVTALTGLGPDRDFAKQGVARFLGALQA